MSMHTIQLFELTLGDWEVSFVDSDKILTLEHGKEGIQISGSLSFSSGGAVWQVSLPRDAALKRLALIDDKDNVQGYISFQGEGGGLSLLVHHRTAQNYQGALSFDGKADFTLESFACRTQPLENGRVMQMASGPADSTLNDSLFDPERDMALIVRAPSVRFSSLGPGSFALRLSGRIDDAAASLWSFSFERDYYKSRYIPYYKPIDRKRCPAPPSGWMSWNTYFDQATASDNLAEAMIGKEHLAPFGMEFWSIESWQDNSDALPVSRFDNLSLKPSPRKFPDGMKKLADDIRSLGFRPGIWIPPFGTGSEEFYQTHKGWFLHDKNGKPLSTWNGIYTIDPSQDEVIDYLRELFRKASRDWGYEFFKIDGMSGRDHSLCAHFFERPEVKEAFKYPCPDPFIRCVKAFREGIGEDRVFLACQGHCTGAEVAYADASRTGADIVHPNQPPLWENLLNQARCTLNQIFAHNIVFFADPDTLLVGKFLEIEQARLATTVVALPGQMMFSGDKLAELAPERMRLLQQALPVCDVRPLDLFPVFRMLPVWDVKVKRSFGAWDIVALFNWSEEENTLGFNFSELGLDNDTEYVLYEFWTNTYQGVRSERFEMLVPGHGVRLLSLHRALSRPQFLSSDRHILQGAVELTRLSWNAPVKSLTGAVKAVRNHPLTLRFRVPSDFSFDVAASDGDVRCGAVAESEDVVSLTLISPVSKEVSFTLSFT